MLDPVLHQLSIQASAKPASVPAFAHSARDPLFRADIERFNPFLTLVTPELSESFYPVLSIYNAFSLVSCNRLRHDEGLSCVSLDHTNGFIMATQGRYPDSVFYTLYRDNWDRHRSDIGLEAVIQQASNLEELSIYTLASNSMGVDLCFCSIPTLEKLETATSLTRDGGSLIVWVDKLVDREWKELLVSSFERVVAYKPATTSPVSVGLYLVCSGRGLQSAGTLEDRVEQFSSQLVFIEQYREGCLQAILARVDNTAVCDPHLAKLQWLGI